MLLYTFMKRVSTPSQVTNQEVLDLLSLVRKVVRHYVRRGSIPQRESDDVVMSIAEKFLDRKNLIDARFKGEAKKTTYYIAVMHRMCCEVIRAQHRNWQLVDDSVDSRMECMASDDYETERQMMLDQEVNRLKHLLAFTQDDRAKLILFFKVYFDLQLHEQDVQLYAKNRTKEVMLLLLESTDRSKDSIFDRLSKTVNVVEKKQIKKDAVRMWFNSQLERLLTRMNMHDGSRHTKESLSVLLEMMFRP